MSVLTLAEVKSHLRLTTTANDTVLPSFISAAESGIVARVGPLAPTAAVETHDGGGIMIRLLTRPVISVASVFESYGTTNRVLTEQPLDGSGGFSAYGYTIEKAEGVVERRISGIAGAFAPGRRNITVSYTAGWASDGTSATLPADLAEAVKEQVRHLWSDSQRGPTARPGSPEEEEAAPGVRGAFMASLSPVVEQLIAAFDDIGIG